MDENNCVHDRWSKEQECYQEFGKKVKTELESLLFSNGIEAVVTYRLKEAESIRKKMLRKNKTYDQIYDKVGVRAVVQFKKHLEKADKLIKENFNYNLRDDMSEKLGDTIFGYQSIHYDLLQSVSDMEIYCELQLRTTCQHNWSEMSHSLIYKSDIEIPKNISREINAISAVFELMDNQFQHIYDLIERLPDTHPARILRYLEELFFKNNMGPSYDKELSSYFLAKVDKLYRSNDVIEQLRTFVENNLNCILRLTRKYKDKNVFFSQPEIFIILERLENARYDLLHYWEDLYPRNELEVIAISWGAPY